MKIVATEWREIVSSTLRGFVTLVLTPPGIVLRDCSVHEHRPRRWICLPVKPLLDSEGRQRVHPTTGRKVNFTVVEIKSKNERAQFQIEALAAVDRLLGKGDAP